MGSEPTGSACTARDVSASSPLRPARKPARCGIGDPLGEQRAAEHDAVVVDRSHRAVIAPRVPTVGLAAFDQHQHVAEARRRVLHRNLGPDGPSGRDHWLQTELGDVTYLDTELGRGEPLLTYPKKMVFWSDVGPRPPMAVLSLLGPG